MATTKTSRRRSTKSNRGTRSRRNERSSGFGDGLKSTITAVGRFLTGEIAVEFESLHDLFVKELNDLYSAENQLIEALPKMAEASSSKALKTAFRDHLKETRGQVVRLERIFKELDLKPESKKCKAMEGLIREGDEWISESAASGVKDAGLIAAAQRVEHYEMAGYGCVRTFARLLGHRAVADILQSTLDEEGSADKKLTELAKRINVQAKPPVASAHNGKRRAK